MFECLIHLFHRFKPEDIEIFLKLQQQVDEAQEKFGATNKTPVMSKLFKIPTALLVSAMPKFESISNRFSFLFDAVILSEMIKNCTSQQLDLSCRDEINVSYCLFFNMFEIKKFLLLFESYLY